MTVLCHGWMRRGQIHVHDPKCDWPTERTGPDDTHSFSPACLKAYRIANGLAPLKEEEQCD